MVDKITTIRRNKLGEQIGVLSDSDMTRLERVMLVFLEWSADQPRPVQSTRATARVGPPCAPTTFSGKPTKVNRVPTTSVSTRFS